MKRVFGVIAVVAVAALVSVAAASATTGNWWHHTLKNGKVTCNRSDVSPNASDLPFSFDTKADCKAFTEAFFAYACDNGDTIQFEAGSQDAANAAEANYLADNEEATAGQCGEVDNSGGLAGTPAGIFLCYSADQVTPSVWPAGQAAQLLAGGGYWQAYAVKGNVAGGTNVGGYHLVCNLASGQAVGGAFADEGGWGTAPGEHSGIVGALGWYPVISG